LSSGISTGQRWILGKHPLQKRQEEGNSLSGTGLGLSNDISSFESRLDSLGLNRCHDIVSHVLGDGANQALVHALKISEADLGLSICCSRLCLLSSGLATVSPERGNLVDRSNGKTSCQSLTADDRQSGSGLGEEGSRSGGPGLSGTAPEAGSKHDADLIKERYLQRLLYCN